MKKNLLLLSSLFAASLATACGCFTIPMAEHVKNADRIFLGTVTKRIISDTPYPTAFYTFSVERVFKGEKTEMLVIQTATNSAACGVEFEVGRTYLVYSNKERTSYCTRTGLADNHPDIESMKRLRLPIL